MKVVLGGMELRSSEKPDSVQHGGGQMLAVNQFPSGNVSIQNFGSTYDDISWSGWFEGPDAMQRMYSIGNMRQQGKPIDFVTENYSQNVIISQFKAEHRTNFFIPFSITLKRIIQLTKKQSDEAVDKASQSISENNESSEASSGSSKSGSKSSQNANKGQKYAIKSGDTLSAIAKRVYGNANSYDKIYEANKDILTKGPHLIYPGQELILP